MLLLLIIIGAVLLDNSHHFLIGIEDKNFKNEIGENVLVLTGELNFSGATIYYV